jgi:hypothetical protein
MLRLSRLSLAVLPALFGLSFANSAQAFSEDICYRYVDPQSKTGDVVPKAFNCWNIQCTDSIRPAPPPAQCVVGGLAKYLDATLARGLHGRDMVHFDALYLFAKMQGLSEQDAFEAAMYSQSTDLGNYVHNDANGKVIPGAQTDNLYGLVRTNNPSLGFSLHFVTWLQGKDHATSSKLTYQPDYAHQHLPTPFPEVEAHINHLRTWAFGGRKTVCQFGLTQNQRDPAAPCFEEKANNPATAFVSYSVLGGDQMRIEKPPMNLSWQAMKLVGPEDCGTKNTEACQYEPGYAESIHGTPRSLGIYLHVLGDRLSHSYCSDSAYFTQGPDPRQTTDPKDAAKATYSLWYSGECNQISHAIRHYPEIGHKVIPPQTKAALDYMFREIKEWIKAKDYFRHYPLQKAATPRRGYPTLDQTGKVVNLVGKALKLADAGERNAALCKLARDGYGISPWHDGSTDCKYPAHR